MNYGELKAELIGLGFSDESELAEFGDILPQAVNRAVTEINLTTAPIIGIYEFSQDGTEDDYIYYDIVELTKEGERVTFLDFADTPVAIGKGVYKKFSDYEIERDNVLVIAGGIKGDFKVFYKKAHVPFTNETSDVTELPLPLKAHVLVPLLTAYYVWLEDEKSKAVDYYNQYEKLSQSIQSAKQPRMKILSGGI